MRVRARVQGTRGTLPQPPVKVRVRVRIRVKVGVRVRVGVRARVRASGRRLLRPHGLEEGAR